MGTVVAYGGYDRVAAVFGAIGMRVDDPELAAATLAAVAAVASGQPALVSAILGKTDFRKGSISR